MKFFTSKVGFAIVVLLFLVPKPKRWICASHPRRVVFMHCVNSVNFVLFISQLKRARCRSINSTILCWLFFKDHTLWKQIPPSVKIFWSAEKKTMTFSHKRGVIVNAFGWEFTTRFHIFTTQRSTSVNGKKGVLCKHKHRKKCLLN